MQPPQQQQHLFEHGLQQHSQEHPALAHSLQQHSQTASQEDDSEQSQLSSKRLGSPGPLHSPERQLPPPSQEAERSPDSGEALASPTVAEAKPEADDISDVKLDSAYDMPSSSPATIKRNLENSVSPHSDRTFMMV